MKGQVMKTLTVEQFPRTRIPVPGSRAKIICYEVRSRPWDRVAWVIIN